jgi:hypothetical protein
MAQKSQLALSFWGFWGFRGTAWRGAERMQLLLAVSIIKIGFSQEGVARKGRILFFWDWQQYLSARLILALVL